MNAQTTRYIGRHAVKKISEGVYVLRGEWETTFIYERGERSFFRAFRLRRVPLCGYKGLGPGEI